MKIATTRLALGTLLAATMAAAPVSAITLDGTLDAGYIVRSTQTTQTNFGDSNLGMVPWANGSELDEVSATFDGTTLYLFFAGNLESNFNKLEIFIDCIDGGQNPLRGDNPNVDFNGLNRMANLRFDTGFEPDFYMTATGGDAGGGDYKMFANFAELLTGGGGAGGFLAGTDEAGYNGGPNFKNIEFTINNSNSAGVDGGCGPASGAGRTTGIEISIPLASIGNPTGCIKVAAFVNGGGHDFVSNQVLAPLPSGTCNLGEPSTVDFNAHSGDQFFTICDNPTPAKVSTWGRIKTLYR